MIFAAWVCLPIIVSNSFWFEVPLFRMVRMVADQAVHLSNGREMRKRLVSKTHPKTVFTSSKAPSAMIFDCLRKAFLGSGSLVAKGRTVASMARGTAAVRRFLLREPVSTFADMKSSKKTSLLPESSFGRFTASSRAGAKGISSGSKLGGGTYLALAKTIHRGPNRHILGVHSIDRKLALKLKTTQTAKAIHRR